MAIDDAAAIAIDDSSGHESQVPGERDDVDRCAIECGKGRERKFFRFDAAHGDQRALDTRPIGALERAALAVRDHERDPGACGPITIEPVYECLQVAAAARREDGDAHAHASEPPKFGTRKGLPTRSCPTVVLGPCPG